MSSEGPQPRASRQVVSATEDRTTDIGWIVEHAADRRRMPSTCALPCPATHSVQATAYLAQAYSLQSDPSENQPDNAGLLFDDFEASQPAAVVAANITVSERSAGQRADRPATRSVSTPAPAALQNFRLLIFCDHALNLEQEIIFRRAANRMFQKNDLHARPLKLLDKKDLMRIAPGKPVRGVDILISSLIGLHIH